MRIFTPNSSLRHLHSLSDGRHSLVTDPEQAEIILVLSTWKDGSEVQDHELVNRFPEKCFIISTSHQPVYKARGIYTTTQGFWSRFANRTRTGCYTLGEKAFQNPFVEAGAALATQKKYLFSFVGRDCHPVRRALLTAKFRREDVYIEDSSQSFALWDKNRDENTISSRQHYFCELMKASKFALCPRGASPNSIRLFESMKLGLAPVVLSDDYRFPLGPKWNEFNIVVKEKHVSELDAILSGYESDFLAMGEKAAAAYDEYFAEAAYFNFLVENCCDILRQQWLPEWLARPLIAADYSLSGCLPKQLLPRTFRSCIKRSARASTREGTV